MEFSTWIGVVAIIAIVTTLTAKVIHHRATSAGAVSKRIARGGRAAGDLLTCGGDLKLRFVWCPAGSFLMGSPESDPDADDDEKPQVEVTLSQGFWLAQTQVTQGLWQAVMGTAPWSGKEYVKEGPNFAATYVPHGDQRHSPEPDSAQAFCARLTERERKAGRLPPDHEFRLPTEAEWEYACRAGTTTIYHFGDSGRRISDYAWRKSNTVDVENEHAHEVGLKLPNPWGLYDMYGNVDEWCEDIYEKALPGGSDPIVDDSKHESHDLATVDFAHLGLYMLYASRQRRVSRGGCYFASRESLRSASRSSGHKGSEFMYFDGFRIALSSARLDQDSEPAPRK